MHILGVKELHELIREFARDSVPPTPSCNAVRAVAARVLIVKPCEYFLRIEDEEHGRNVCPDTGVPESDDEETCKKHRERYVNWFSGDCFLLKYDGETRMMRVKHETVADEDKYYPSVKSMVLELEQDLIDGSDRTPQTWDRYMHRLRAIRTRFVAWRKRVRGRTWSAACTDEWNTWPLEKIEVNRDLYELYCRERSLYFRKYEKIDHIVDLSTLSLLQD